MGSDEVIKMGPYRLSLSIGGMSCASCSATITDLVSSLPEVSDIRVNLLDNSGSMCVQRKDLADIIVEVIENAGYEANVVSITPVNSIIKREDDLSPSARTISLRVEGMFSRQCPETVMATLEQFGSQITIERPLTDQHDPILQITYLPSPPAFTIRVIMDAITTTNSRYKVSVYNPPSLEEHARDIQFREQKDLLCRLAFAVLVAIPTFIIGVVFASLVPVGNHTRRLFMEPMWTGNASRMQWSLFFLATPVMFYSAGTFHRRSLMEIHALWRRGSKVPMWKRFLRFGSMNLLISLGVSVAYFLSIVLLVLAAIDNRSSDGMGDTTTYFDSVVFLTMFLLIGRYLEAYSKGRTSDAITDLGKLRPAEAYLLVPFSDSNRSSPLIRDLSFDVEKGDINSEVEASLAKPGFQVQKISVELLEVGDIVRVVNGSTPPADGIIVSGESTFNESSLTGESRPIKKAVGDQVFLGTINTAQVVDVKVGAIGGETMLDQIVHLVRDGQTKRAPIERLADHITGYFVPVVTFLAIATWVIWLSLGMSGVLPRSYLDKKIGGWPVWSLEFAIAVFVVACPCGIGLAAPTALLVGSGLAAKLGILVRGGGEAFQEAAHLDVVVFDKTGTLTQGGEPRVTNAEIYKTATLTSEVILGLAANIEAASTHPLAVAIRTYCQDKGTVSSSGSEMEEIPGRGLKGYFDLRRCAVIIGNEQWVMENGAVITEATTGLLKSWKEEGKSIVVLAVRNDTGEEHAKSTPFQVAAVFAVSDPIRPNAKATISQLQAQGLSTWMLSGDNPITAKAVAKLVGIPEQNVIAGVLPHEKAQNIKLLQDTGPKRRWSVWKGPFGQKTNERCIVAMVGDGINDAPALASADVAIAIGSGSDVALSSASFILMSSDLSGVITLIDLSRTVFRRVQFNFMWAIVYNLVALPIAAGVIYPAGHARLNPVWGSLAMALSSVSVVCSSLFLKLYKPPKVLS
ncbi:E1-E2 ATPase-domain-containing protein [Flammula alnicola]|nr:E1-E2 ATPase-domain-containing protein [Flammula alnicola]